MLIHITLYLLIVIIGTLVAITWDPKASLSGQAFMASFTFSNILAVVSLLIFHLIYQSIY